MTTQSKLNNSVESAPAHVVKPHLNWPLAFAFLALGLILGIIAASLPFVDNLTGVSGVPEPIIRDFPGRPNLIDLERQELLADEAQAERSMAAEAARYTGLATLFIGKNELNRQQGLEAEAARHIGLANFYLTKDEANGQRAIEAEAARYNGLADFYSTEAGPDSLAWPPRPVQFYPINETVIPAQNAFAKYVRSIAEKKAAADQDLGLMDFSTIADDVEVRRLNCGPVSPCASVYAPTVNEVGVIRHDREYGLAAFSIISEVGADRDIGLMEFFTAKK